MPSSANNSNFGLHRRQGRGTIVNYNGKKYSCATPNFSELSCSEITTQYKNNNQIAIARGTGAGVPNSKRGVTRGAGSVMRGGMSRTANRQARTRRSVTRRPARGMVMRPTGADVRRGTARAGGVGRRGAAPRGAMQKMRSKRY